MFQFTNSVRKINQIESWISLPCFLCVLITLHVCGYKEKIVESSVYGSSSTTNTSSSPRYTQSPYPPTPPRPYYTQRDVLFWWTRHWSLYYIIAIELIPLPLTNKGCVINSHGILINFHREKTRAAIIVFAFHRNWKRFEIRSNGLRIRRE